MASARLPSVLPRIHQKRGRKHLSCSSSHRISHSICNCRCGKTLFIFSRPISISIEIEQRPGQFVVITRVARDFPFSLSNWIKSDGKTKINRDRLFSILVAKKKKRGTNPVRTRRDRGRPLIRIDCRRGGDFPFFLLLFVLLGVAVACRSHKRQQTTAR